MLSLYPMLLDTYPGVLEGRGMTNDAMPGHRPTISRRVRQLGRLRVTDWFWRCTCGAATTAPNGRRYRREAEQEFRGHLRDVRRAVVLRRVS